MKMLDYVQLAHVRMGENLERSSELVSQLVEIFQSASFDALRIVASGSSRHAADCARDYLQDALQMQVSVVTPEAFVDFEHTYPQNALNIAISQSGYSTNTIAALDYMRTHDMAAVALTANVEAPIKEHADIVLDYGVGVESVDFVTLGVQTLIEYLVLFGIYGGQARGAIGADGVAQRLSDLNDAIQANATMCKTAEAYVQDNLLELSEHVPAMVVGNGPNYGVAEEAALKLSETIKIPAMHHEGEEFVHGPEMQIVPGYLVFIVDDPQGSERLANIADALSKVTKKAVLLTMHPKGKAHEIAVPQVAPLLSAIPNLVFFQTMAAIVTERLNSWDVHPYLDAVLDAVMEKLPGFPIVLHGSSSVPQEEVDTINKYGGKLEAAIGIPEEQLRKAAKSAVCKINIDSDSRLAMTAAIRKTFAEKPAEFDPRKYLGPARDNMEKLYKHKIINVLGSENKLAQLD